MILVDWHEKAFNYAAPILKTFSPLISALADEMPNLKYAKDDIERAKIIYDVLYDYAFGKALDAAKKQIIEKVVKEVIIPQAVKKAAKKAIGNVVPVLNVLSFIIDAIQDIYESAAADTQYVGMRIAEFIRDSGMDPKNVHCIGHSLGR